MNRYAETMKILNLLILCSIFFEQPLGACPVYLGRGQVKPERFTKRNQLAVFAKSGSQWIAIPFQIDERTARLKLVFHSNKSWLNSKTHPRDRILFESNQAHPKVTNFTGFPCASKSVYEIKYKKNGSTSYAYVAWCKGVSKVPATKRELEYDLGVGRVRSNNYVYDLNKANYMLFHAIYANDKKGNFIKVIENSNLHIKGDVKNFLNLRFGSNDIKSTLEAHEKSSMGIFARIDFFLHVLFFKVKLKLLTDISFYNTSAHIPMRVSLPVNGYDYLNMGSRLYYYWQLSKDKPWKFRAKMPVHGLNVKKSEVLKKYCNRYYCHFRLDIYHGDISLQLHFNINRRVVDKLDFYPTMVDNRELTKDRVVRSTDGKDHLGVYFEGSRLPKGSHPWDFWMKVNDDSKDSCPTKPLSTRKIKI